MGLGLADLDLVVPADPMDRVVPDPAVPVVPDPAVPDPVAPDPVAPDPADLRARTDPVVPDPADLRARTDPADLRARTDPAGLGRMAPAVPVDLHLVGRAVLGRTDRVVPVDPVDLAVLGRVARAARAGLVLTDLVVPVGRADPVALTAPGDLVVLVNPDTPDPVGRVVPVGRAGPVAPAALVVLEVLVNPDTAGLVVPADRHRPPMCSAVSTTVAGRSGVARATHRTASALPITARRHRPGKMGSAGMVVLLPELRRPTGMDRLLPEAGTDRRPLAAGTPAGMGRRAT